MRFVTLILLAARFVFASLHAQETALADPERAKRVPVVLRVRLIHQGEGSKYLWPEVELVAVIKNESSYTFPKRFEVAILSHEGGGKIPDGTSTVYLERYSDVPGSLWRLLGSTAATGVSNTTGP